MNDVSENKAVALLEPPSRSDGLNGNHTVVATDELPIAKLVSNEQRIAEEKFLTAKEAEVERRYAGIRGWLRVAHVTLVIGKLALYLYLDQLDIHRKQQLRHAKERMRRAEMLTRAAVFGEWLFGIKLAIFHWFMSVLRYFVIGKETNREINQKKQAVWLKEKL